MTSYAMQIYTGFLNDVEKEEGVTLELMPEETNWLELDYGE
jgi:hypothetical protein